MNKSLGLLLWLLFAVVIMASFMNSQEMPDKNYEVVLGPQYREARDFRCGLATVVIGNPAFINWSVINREGQVLINGDLGPWGLKEFREFVNDQFKKSDKVCRFYDKYKWTYTYVDKQGKIIKTSRRYEVRDDRLYALVDLAEELAEEEEYLNLYPRRKGKKWGYGSMQLKMAIDFQFDDARPFSEGLAAVKKDKQWGFIGKEGHFIVEPQFEKVEDFAGGLARVRKAGLWGVLNKQGEFLIKPQFEKVEDFVGGMAKVRKAKLWGVVDTEGAVVADCQYEEIGEFAEGMAPVRLNRKWGYINDQGQLAVDCLYQETAPFLNGMAKVRLKGWGVIDRSGKVIVPLKYDYLREFCNGMIAFAQRGFGDKWGFVNEHGKVAIEPIFKSVSNFNHEGVAIVKEKGKLGLIDKKGEKVLETDFGYIALRNYIVSTGATGSVQLDSESPSDERIQEKTRIIIEEISKVLEDLLPIWQYDGKWGFINNRGQIVIDFIYDDVKPFSEGLAAVRLDNKWGYIKKNGEFAIPPQYVDADSFSEGLAAVNMTAGALKSPKYGFINKEGALVIDYEFLKVGRFSEGLAYVNLKAHKLFGSEAILGYIQLKKKE